MLRTHTHDPAKVHYTYSMCTYSQRNTYALKAEGVLDLQISAWTESHLKTFELFKPANS